MTTNIFSICSKENCHHTCELLHKGKPWRFERCLADCVNLSLEAELQKRLEILVSLKSWNWSDPCFHCSYQPPAVVYARHLYHSCTVSQYLMTSLPVVEELMSTALFIAPIWHWCDYAHERKWDPTHLTWEWNCSVSDVGWFINVVFCILLVWTSKVMIYPSIASHQQFDAV